VFSLPSLVQSLSEIRAPIAIFKVAASVRDQSRAIAMNITLHTAQTENGWVAATDASPYFCFQAETEQLVIAKARSALAFFVQSSDKISIFHLKQEQASRVPTLRNARRELMTA
jgi:predicted RNase H-like HicB family nuclease